MSCQKLELRPGASEERLTRIIKHNLQEVLFVVGGRSLDDTDDEDEEDEDRNPIVLPHNCAYYDAKLGMGRRIA